VIQVRLDELARRLGVELIGDGGKEIRGVQPLEKAAADDLSFFHNPRYAEQARNSRAGAVLLADPSLLPGRDVLVCEHPYLAFARALAIFHPAEPAPVGVHCSAVVAAGASLGDDVSIGPHVVIGPGSRVGSGTVIGAGSVLGDQVEVGEGCLIHPRVVIEDRCRVGDRCILHAGVVIGSDGYGFATVDGVHHKVPQVGRVVVEDDVELGANVCIDRGTLGDTRIGRGTKVDNLVQVAHNVQVGEGCLLVAQAGISGSTSLGHHVVMAGQAGVAGHLRVGDLAVITAKTAVFKDVSDGAMVSGNPARPQREWLTANAELRRLAGVRKRLAELERRVAELENDAPDAAEEER
jgi:UDP-3-O-[3-hydroxymyristoyl] glucosamine N-acyltransferase